MRAITVPAILAILALNAVSIYLQTNQSQNVSDSEVRDDKRIADHSPTFEGKPLGEWLDVLGRERSPAWLASALHAIENLVESSVNEANAELVVQSVWTFYANSDPQLNISSPNAPVRFSREFVGPIIAKCLRRKYCEWYFSLLQGGEEKTIERLLDLPPLPTGLEFDPRDLNPLAFWLEQKIDPSRLTDEQRKQLIITIAIALSKNRDETSERLAQSICRSRRLSDDFWLDQGALAKTSYFRGKLFEVAIRVLKQSDSSSDQVANACCILSNSIEKMNEVNDGNDLSSFLNEQELVNYIQSRINQCCQDPQQLYSLNRVCHGIDVHFEPIQFVSLRCHFSNFPIAYRNVASPTIELLHLAKLLDMQKENPINELLVVTKLKYDAIVKAWPRIEKAKTDSFPPPFYQGPIVGDFETFNLFIPDFKLFDSNMRQQIESMQFSQSEWLGFLIYLKASSISNR